MVVPRPIDRDVFGGSAVTFSDVLGDQPARLQAVVDALAVERVDAAGGVADQRPVAPRDVRDRTAHRQQRGGLHPQLLPEAELLTEAVGLTDRARDDEYFRSRPVGSRRAGVGTPSLSSTFLASDSSHGPAGSIAVTMRVNGGMSRGWTVARSMISRTLKVSPSVLFTPLIFGSQKRARRRAAN